MWRPVHQNQRATHELLECDQPSTYDLIVNFREDEP